MTKFIQKSIWKGFRGWIGGLKAAVIKYLPLSKEKIMWTWINKNKEKGADSRTVLETELIGLSGHLCDTVSLIQQHGRRVRWWIDMLRWRFLWTWESTADVRFSSAAQLCLILCDPMVCSMPGFPVHHKLPELTQTHVHWVGDAIQPSHHLSSPSPPIFNLSQHQGLF